MSTATGHRVRPPQVVAAILNGDSYALSVMGHFGGKAAAARQRVRPKCKPITRMDAVQQDIADSILKEYYDGINARDAYAHAMHNLAGSSQD